MNAIPAQIAGVPPRIAIITPAGKDGQVDDGVLAAAKVLGIDEVYKLVVPKLSLPLQWEQTRSLLLIKSSVLETFM